MVPTRMKIATPARVKLVDIIRVPKIASPEVIFNTPMTAPAGADTAAEMNTAHSDMITLQSVT